MNGHGRTEGTAQPHVLSATVFSTKPANLIYFYDHRGPADSKVVVSTERSRFPHSCATRSPGAIKPMSSFPRPPTASRFRRVGKNAEVACRSLDESRARPTHVTDRQAKNKREVRYDNKAHVDTSTPPDRLGPTAGPAWAFILGQRTARGFYSIECPRTFAFKPTEADRRTWMLATSPRFN